MPQEYETISKFDRAYSGLLGGNCTATKPTTIETVEKILGETETFIVQTIRDPDGDHVVIKYVDKEGVTRIILPPKVANTILLQRDRLTSQRRSALSKAAMRERMAQGYVPTPPPPRRKRKPKNTE